MDNENAFQVLDSRVWISKTGLPAFQRIWLNDQRLTTQRNPLSAVQEVERGTNLK
jgi:hypothetical protein